MRLECVKYYLPWENTCIFEAASSADSMATADT